MALIRVGALAVGIALSPFAWAGVDTSPDILGTWSAVSGGEPEILRDFAGADGLFVAATRGPFGWGDLGREIFVDVRDPTAPVEILSRPLSFGTIEQGQSIERPGGMRVSGPALEHVEAYFSFDEFGVYEAIDYRVRPMPRSDGPSDLRNPADGGTGRLDWPMGAFRLETDGLWVGDFLAGAEQVFPDGFEGSEIWELDDGRLYLTYAGGSGMSVYDVSAMPGDPVLVSDQYPLPGESAVVQDSLLVIGRESTPTRQEFTIYDTRPVTGPPAALSAIAVDHSAGLPATVLGLDEGRLYVSVVFEGLKVYDIVVPNDPRLIADYESLSSTEKIGFGDGVFYAMGRIEGADRVVTAGVPALLRCSRSDVAEPFGTLDLAHLSVFVTGFLAGDAIADAELPLGVLDLADLQGFVGAFNAGCR